MTSKLMRAFFSGLDECACCGRLLVLPPVYVAGAYHCGPCSRKDHRHPRDARAA
ncbi:MAG: hypothetical protein ACRDGE_07410 [Candidatus Limnocylindria bacterium]